MKIAIFHELHRGGARRSLNEVAKRLKENHIVDLYIVDEKKEESEKEYFNSVRFFRFIPKKWTGRDWKIRLYKDSIELLKLFFLHKQIAKDINDKHYDIVLVHPSQYTQAPFILKHLTEKTIYYCHEPLRLAYDPFLKFNSKNLKKRIYEKCVRQLRKVIDKNNTLSADVLITNSKLGWLFQKQEM